MRESHPRERVVGIDHYVSGADGVGGRLRDRPEDFRVRELEAFDVHSTDADTGDYPYLVLRATLRGWDTNDFASRLSDALGASRERVDWAGTKDKYAVTTQLFTVYDADPGDLPQIRDADVDVVGRAGRHLSFGDLAGNAFEITVRDPERPANAATITASLAEFAGADAGDDESDVAGAAADGVTVGVPNVFGHQRFGSVRPVTHEVGLNVVRRGWREAVLSYVGNPVEAEPADTQAARGLVDEEAATENPDWHACLEEMPRKLGFERSMLHRLADDGSETDADWRHALEAVPSNLQRLFVNAAQSYAFNRMLSERLERGLPFHRPVAGDVCCFADRVERRSADTGSRSNDDGAAAVERPDPDRTQRATESRVDVLTRHCERGRAFVTAPLVGTGTELADGEQGEIERAVLDDLDLEPAMFDLPGEFESTGTRRAVLARTEMRVAREPLTFSFALPSGSYATTVLREYLKVDPTAL